ncbi:hypothetical protein Nmel_013283 [Mimus melanotis]
MEHISTPKVENVKLLDRYANRKAASGTLYLTATHLIYVDASAEILHHHISSVEKLPLTTAGYPLLIHCKNFHVAHFVIGQERDCHDVFTSLLKLSQPVKPEELYAFSYNPKMSKESREMGWKLIDLRLDYQRMGIPNTSWEITDINKDYEVCSTYPPEIVVPRAATRAVVMGSSRFRSRGRIPVLSYLYKENNAALCRCSQPLAGFSARCLEDEQMLQAIREANPGCPFMYVVDTRPKVPPWALGCFAISCLDEQCCCHFVLSQFWVALFPLGKWEFLYYFYTTMCGHLDGDPKEVSPVFTQFVECVWQLMQQFPCSFEFSERFLLEIHDHVYSCQFGNFLGTCHKDREELSDQMLFLLARIFEKTHSLWPFLLQRKQELRNPLYRGFTAYKELQPNTLPFSFQFWCGMYNRFDKGMHPKQCVLDQLLSCSSQKVTLEDNASQLENKLPLLDGPLPSRGCTSPEAGAAAAQDCAEGAVLSNGPSLGPQKHKESPAQPQGASREDGQAEHQG